MNETKKISYAGIYLALSIILVFIQIPILPSYGIAIDLALVPIIIARRQIGTEYAVLIAFFYPWFTCIGYIGGGVVGAFFLLLASLLFILGDYLFEIKSNWKFFAWKDKIFLEKRQVESTRINLIKKNLESEVNASKNLSNQYSFSKMWIWHFFSVLIITLILLIVNLFLIWPLYLYSSSNSWIPGNENFAYYFIVFTITFITTYVRYCVVYLVISLIYPIIYHYF